MLSRYGRRSERNIYSLPLPFAFASLSLSLSLSSVAETAGNEVVGLSLRSLRWRARGTKNATPLCRMANERTTATYSRA